jgi:hypothetical protein
MGFTYAKVGKKAEKPLLGQILELVPKTLFINSVHQFKSDKHCSTYKTWDEFVAMLFGQLNKCLSLREISMGLSITPEFLNDVGLEQSPAKSTMSDGNAKRGYQVFEHIYFKLIDHYKNVFSKRSEYKVIEEIKGKNIKIIDSTTMSVCLNLFSWAKFRTAKGGVKVHTSLDEALMIPEMIYISEAKVSDRRGVDNFRYTEDTIVVDDRGYFDFKLFKIRIDDKNHFVTRIKDNTLYESVIEKELPDDKDFHVLKDEIILLTGKAAKDAGIDQEKLRRVAIFIEEDNRTIEVITNNLEWSAATIAELYRRRWLIETFFKLIKQNLQIKTFLGTSQNACKSQIFVALIAYFLLELIRRTISKVKHCFGHFVTLIRVCLTQYNGLPYIVNEIKITVQKARQLKKEPEPDGQLRLKMR